MTDLHDSPYLHAIEAMQMTSSATIGLLQCILGLSGPRELQVGIEPTGSVTRDQSAQIHDTQVQDWTARMLLAIL